MGQVTCIDSEHLMERKEESAGGHAPRCRRSTSYDMVILMLTDVLQEGTQLLYIGSDDAIRNAFAVEPKDNTVFLPGRHVPQEAGHSHADHPVGLIFPHFTQGQAWGTLRREGAPGRLLYLRLISFLETV